MNVEMEVKPATAGNETEGAIPSSNASYSSPSDDKRSPGRNPTEKRSREEDVEAEEEKSPSLEESDRGREGGGADLHPMRKTSLCSFFRRPPGGVCRHGGACRYAHGEAELRLRPDNSWDPTSERAKKKLKTSAGDAAEGEAEEEDDAAVDLTCLDKCLIGLPKKWASDNLKSFLDGQRISYKTAKKKKGMTVGFVSFENAEQIKSAIEVLKENTSNGKHIKVADAVHRSQEKKKTMEITIKSSSTEDGSLLSSSNLTEDGSAFGTSSVEGAVTKTKTVRDVVTPLAHIFYIDQLEQKKNSLLQTLKRLTRNARKACPDAAPLPEWILKSREIGGLPCKLEGILESPLVDGYRNKCEFSVGCSLQGKRTVGFMLGNFREGVTAVEEPASCPNVSRISCKYALIFQDFLQSSEFPVWNRIDNTGFWRQFTVREGRSPGQVALNGSVGIEIAEVMLIVQVCSLGYEEHTSCEFIRMTHALTHGASACSPPLPLTAIVVQDHRGISNAAPADCPLILLELPKADGLGGSGVTVTAEARIHDYISNLRFSISPTAFFQVNTLAAERMYSLVGDCAGLSPDTLLFDICCGTGTIGLTLAHRVGMVVGIEMNASAVSDATRNAEINGIKNCRFICGKAEDVMGAILKEYLDVPEHHGEVSNDLGNNGVCNVGNETDKTIEDFQDDTDAPAAVSAANPRTEKEMLPCSRDRTMDKLAGHIEGNNGDGISKQLIGDSDDSAGFPGTRIAECTGTSHQNKEFRDTNPDGKYINYTSKDSFEFRNQRQENILLEQSTATNAAAVHQFKKVVAIVDPPRVGLHPTVIKALRTHPRIRRLVYISCNPEALVANAIELCTPTADKPEKAKGNRGWRNMSSASLARYRVKSMPSSVPFRPVRAMAVDLFPHTPHCEMVMLLER